MKMAKQINKKEENKWASSGLFIPAGLMIGMGLGFMYNELVAGLFIGLGAGFALAALFKLFAR